MKEKDEVPSKQSSGSLLGQLLLSEHLEESSHRAPVRFRGRVRAPQLVLHFTPPEGRPRFPRCVL